MNFVFNRVVSYRFKLIFVIFCFSLLVSANFTFAATPAIQPGQLELLKSLTPTQQALLMQRLSGSGGNLSSLGSLLGGKTAGPLDIKKDSPVKITKKTEKEKKIDPLTGLEIPEIPLLKGGDTIIVTFEEDLQKDSASAALMSVLAGQEANKEKKILFEPQQKQLLYRLDKNGVLEMPGVGFIPLAGLTVEEAGARLQVEPLLQKRKIQVQLLPLNPQGRAALKPFGHELFEPDEDVSLEPNVDIPIPNDYVVGPGDVIHIQLVGNTNEQHYLDVKRDGTLSFPGVGAIPVAGLTFSQMKSELKKRIEKQFIGVNAYIVLGELRTIRVFVLGEVEKPGSYLVSGISTMTNALLQAQGLKPIASLRRIELRRDGRLVHTLDAYDLLLNGDARKDVRLEAGDVILIPPVKMTVAVGGEVRRPAVYELKGGETAKDVVDLAGGLLPTAYQQRIRMERIAADGIRRTVDIDSQRMSEYKMESGDYIDVAGVDERIDDPVTLTGNVRHPGVFQWRKNMRLSDVVGKLEQLKENADLDYVVIKRYSQPDHRLSVISTSLREIFKDENSVKNLPLQSRDEIVVLDLGERRALQMQPIIGELDSQAKQGDPSQIVRVIGQVRGSGSYPLEKSMRVSDLIRAGGRLKESAFTLEAELTRFIVKPGEPREITHVLVNLEKALRGDVDADVVLQPHDLLNIKEIPLWTEQDRVEIIGEVRFPGVYAIRRGEMLSDLLRRAGGLSTFAYAEGSVFTREELRRREKQRMEEMAASLENEVTLAQNSREPDAEVMQNVGMARQYVEQLRKVEAVGRLVIDLKTISSISRGSGGDKTADIVLRGGDKLYIPARMQEVSVVGQVFHPTSHMHQDQLNAFDYVDMSGGATRKADESNIYVIRANGSVELARKHWFYRSADIFPGDTVVVPFNADYMSGLRLWTNVSQIFYQLSLTLASLNTIGALATFK